MRKLRGGGLGEGDGLGGTPRGQTSTPKMAPGRPAGPPDPRPFFY